MVLQSRSPSKNNQMLGRWLKSKDASQPGHTTPLKEPPAKRQRLDDETIQIPPPSRPAKIEAAESDTENGKKADEVAPTRKTDLESALPVVGTEEDALQEYEAFKASQEDEKQSAEGRLNNRKWVRGQSSLYVDAFNLALDTVLDEESHLFDEAENEVFKQWRNLTANIYTALTP